MTKILIVEDSNLMKAVIANFIERENKGYEIITAINGDEAVSQYQNEKPDLVFMDIKMPGMDGMTALEKIKEIDQDAKVVMCTSLKEASQEKRAEDLGAKGYIKKPFSREEITKALNDNL